jgi:hypothetical protein
MQLSAGDKGMVTHLFRVGYRVHGVYGWEPQHHVPLAVAAENHGGRTLHLLGLGQFHAWGARHVLHLTDDFATLAANAFHSAPPYCENKNKQTKQKSIHATYVDVYASGLLGLWAYYLWIIMQLER